MPRPAWQDSKQRQAGFGAQRAAARAAMGAETATNAAATPSAGALHKRALLAGKAQGS